MSANDPQVLLNDFTDFNVKYAGLIPEIPLEMDPTGRTDILKVIDRAKRGRHLPRVVTPEHDAVLRLNAYSIRVVGRRTRELLLCVPVHQIAAVCYVHEDDVHILGIKIGEVGNNKDISDLAVLYCASENLAIEICNMIEQCFQLVFTDAAMQYCDKRLVEGVTTDMHFMNAIAPSSSSADHPYGALEGPSFISGSRTDLTRIQPSRPQPQSSTGLSDSENYSVTSPMDLIQEYMIILQEMLTPEENSQFALLLKRWRDGNVPLAEFCLKVLELFGPHRKHLLARMRPFMHEDQSYFEAFLEQSGITENAENAFPNHSPMSEFSEDQCMNDSMSEGSVSSTVKVSQPNPLLQDAGVLNDAAGFAATIIHFNEAAPIPMTDFADGQTTPRLDENSSNQSLSLIDNANHFAATRTICAVSGDNVKVLNNGANGAGFGKASNDADAGNGASVAVTTSAAPTERFGDVSIKLANYDHENLNDSPTRSNRYNKRQPPKRRQLQPQRLASGGTAAQRNIANNSRSVEFDMSNLKLGPSASGN